MQFAYAKLVQNKYNERCGVLKKMKYGYKKAINRLKEGGIMVDVGKRSVSLCVVLQLFDNGFERWGFEELFDGVGGLREVAFVFGFFAYTFNLDDGEGYRSEHREDGNNG